MSLTARYDFNLGDFRAIHCCIALTREYISFRNEYSILLVNRKVHTILYNSCNSFVASMAHHRNTKKRDKDEIQGFRQNCIRAVFSARDARTSPLVFHASGDCCEYKISCINFRIFESVSRKSENYDSSVFFAGNAELWSQKNCSRWNADRCAYPVPSFPLSLSLSSFSSSSSSSPSFTVRDLISYRFYAIYRRKTAKISGTRYR